MGKYYPTHFCLLNNPGKRIEFQCFFFQIGVENIEEGNCQYFLRLNKAGKKKVIAKHVFQDSLFSKLWVNLTRYIFLFAHNSWDK